VIKSPKDILPKCLWGILGKLQFIEEMRRDARDAGDAISAFSRKSLAKSFPSIGAAKWVLSLPIAY